MLYLCFSYFSMSPFSSLTEYPIFSEVEEEHIYVITEICLKICCLIVQLLKLMTILVILKAIYSCVFFLRWPLPSYVQ